MQSDRFFHARFFPISTNLLSMDNIRVEFRAKLEGIKSTKGRNQHLIITLIAPPAPVFAVSKAAIVSSSWNLENISLCLFLLALSWLQYGQSLFPLFLSLYFSSSTLCRLKRSNGILRGIYFNHYPHPLPHCKIHFSPAYIAVVGRVTDFFIFEFLSQKDAFYPVFDTFSSFSSPPHYTFFTPGSPFLIFIHGSDHPAPPLTQKHSILQ